MTHVQAYKAVRKEPLPQNCVMVPKKGGGYRRKNKWGKTYDE